MKKKQYLFIPILLSLFFFLLGNQPIIYAGGFNVPKIEGEFHEYKGQPTQGSDPATSDNMTDSSVSSEDNHSKESGWLDWLTEPLTDFWDWTKETASKIWENTKKVVNATWETSKYTFSKYALPIYENILFVIVFFVFPIVVFHPKFRSFADKLWNRIKSLFGVDNSQAHVTDNSQPYGTLKDIQTSDLTLANAS